MIISRTPFRISFFGGGTDHPEWFKNHGGSVLSTTFDKYTYLTCRYLPPFFEHKHRIAYSIVENVQNIEDIAHPAVRAILSELGAEKGLEIHADADLPARSGLGSSSSFVVGLLNVLYAMRGERKSRAFLATEAIRIERDIMGECVGYQDQMAAAYGGFNQIQFHRDGQCAVEPLVFDPARKELLNQHLMLFFTGFSRISSEVAKDQVARVGSNALALQRLNSQVNEAINILCGKGDIRDFGKLLDDAWEHKKSLSSQITTPQISDIYDRAKASGAIGGKLLGAGGGGFMLLFVEPRFQDNVLKALPELVYVPFHFESTGSQVIYYEP